MEFHSYPTRRNSYGIPQLTHRTALAMEFRTTHAPAFLPLKRMATGNRYPQALLN